MNKLSPYSHAGADDAALKFAARELGEAHEMLIAAHAMGDRRERAEAIKAAVGRLALASRQIDEVVERRTKKEPSA